MVQFQIGINNDDLGITPIENIFINHYLPKAPGDFVKVYLLGLKFCFQNAPQHISNEVIAKTLDILESDVVKAWQYWEKQGIIHRTSSEEGKSIITFLNIKEVVLNTSSLATQPPKIGVKEIIDSRRDNRIREMHDVIEKMMGRPLSPIEMSLYHEWMTEYSFSPEVIVLLLEDCFNRGRKELAYLKKVALNWYNAGVKSPEDAEKFMVSHREKWERYFKVMSYLGFKRPPTQKEEEIMDKWFSEFKMDLELIHEACARTTAIPQPNFRYVDRIITDWHGKGYISLEDVQREERKTSKKTTFSKNPSSKGKSNRLDLDHNYDMDRLEKKLLKRNRGGVGE